jgi:hypothetical protein
MQALFQSLMSLISNSGASVRQKKLPVWNTGGAIPVQKKEPGSDEAAG